MTTETPDHNPCKECGSAVRVSHKRIDMLAGHHDLYSRTCLNRGCVTNHTPRTLGMPLP